MQTGPRSSRCNELARNPANEEKIMKTLAHFALAGFLLAAFPAGVARAQLTTPPPPPPGAQSENLVTIPAGTELRAELGTLLSTKTSKNGDLFTARVVEPVFAKGEEIIPEGSTSRGTFLSSRIPGAQPASVRCAWLRTALPLLMELISRWRPACRMLKVREQPT